MQRPLIGVRRDNGHRYVFLTLVTFSVTVMAIRLYLDAAGYPRVGGGGLHVAHMLWGGLLLVVAVLIVQLLVGRRALILSALAAGVGVGLFIDEVGKFITESNDYFFAPAAPIIYGAILLLVVLWLVARRDRRPTVPEATQGAIEAARDLADGRLSMPGRDRAVETLLAAGVTETTPGLAGRMLSLLGSPETEARLAPPGWMERGTGDAWLRRLMPDRVERFLVRIGLLLNTAGGCLGVLIAVVVAGDSITALPEPAGPVEMPDDPFWLLLLGLTWFVVGAVSAVALILSLIGLHARAMAVAQYALLISLVAGGLLDLYVSQLGALTSVVLQVALLLLVQDQRRRLAAGAASDARDPAVTLA